jgi:hypothetical protein
MLDLGTRIKIWAAGQYTATSATPTTTLGFYWFTPGTTTGPAIVSLASIALSASATAWPWQLEYKGKITALGASGSITGQGRIWWPASLTAWSSSGVPGQPGAPIPTTAAARVVAIDTTIAKQVSVGNTWSATTGSPTLICNEVTVELVG